MKKFLLKVSIFVIYALLWHTVYPYFVDPFNVFHYEHIKANGIMPNKNYIKMKYIMNNPDKYNVFLFGSSRAGALHNDRINGEKSYNMVYSAGMPGWHLWNIKTFLQNGIRPQKIYIGLDYGSTAGKSAYIFQLNDHKTCPYEYLQEHKLHFCRLYFDPAVVTWSLNTIVSAWLGRADKINTEAFYQYGWDIPYDRPVRIDWNNKEQVVPWLSYNGAKIDHERLDCTLGIMKEIAELCNVNNIELVIFINPLYYLTYLPATDDENYFVFLESLAEISDFWNFGSINDITLSNDYYVETSHFKAKTGDIMIDIMCNGAEYPELHAQGFGFKVTRENVKDFIKFLKHQADTFTQNS